ncbi:MAG: gamma-glutamyl-gamma-aminobutyrate hydrolase family protein [Anaerolineales bacterium]|nr:gamma-glutamyl-gamma-aminobutyrate hydrolase family protein [Anaerolineales bacterium]
MNDNSPLIGITCHHDTSGSHPDRSLQGQLTSYIKAVTGVGGAPVLIPLDQQDASLWSIFDRLDGLILPGGPDVAPDRYRQIPHKKIGRIDASLDETELKLALWAIKEDLPLLAICRGIQVLNVALGGTLYQDIASEILEALEHHRFTSRGYQPDDQAHDVKVEPDSQLARVLDATRVTTNSRHHQAIKLLGNQLVTNAHTMDGIIEGVEMPGARFAIGVQWHPENLVQSDAHMRRLFEGLIQAARNK